MADNVAKKGVEDVLSSIRRLVSEEGRILPDPVQPPVARKPGKLVLTDALRVGKQPKDEPAPLNPAAEVSARPVPQANSDASAAPAANDLTRPMLLRSCDIVQPGKKVKALDAAVSGGAGQSDENPADLAGSLSAKIEALEEAIARTEDQWEPDGESDDAYSGTPTGNMDWNTDTGFAASASGDLTQDDDPEEIEDARPETAETAETVETATFTRGSAARGGDVVQHSAPELPADVRALDPDALQEMVAEIVRQELQGALGERITRNVRKMVRREINRALAAQDLD